MKKSFILFLLVLLVFGNLAWAQQPTTDRSWFSYANVEGYTPLAPAEDGKIHIYTADDLADVMFAMTVHPPYFLDYYTQYIGKTFVLENDIDMSERWWTPIGSTFTYPDNPNLGTHDQPFRSNFDGNGHTISGIYIDKDREGIGYYGGQYYGLFGYVKGDYTENGVDYEGCDFIKDLTITNSHIEGGDDTGGVIGYLYGEATLENVVCHATVEGTANVGGLVGRTKYCVVDGVEGGEPTHRNPSIKNCLQMGNSVTGSSNVGALIGYLESDIQSSSNLAEVYVSKNYYVNHALNALAGNNVDVNKRGYPIRKGENWPATATFSYPDNGLLNNDIFYAEYAEPIMIGVHTIDLSTRIIDVYLDGEMQGHRQGDYPVNVDNSVTKDYVFTVTVQNTGITGSGTENDPYIISESTDWDIIAGEVAEGTDYYGKYFKINSQLSSITVNTMMGTAETPFRGNFNGSNKKLYFNKGTESTPFTEDGCAPFLYVNGSTIQKLKIEGTIHTSASYAAGLIAFAAGDVTISNCDNNITINSISNAAGMHGGFVAQHNNSSNLTFNNCVFRGKLLGPNTNWVGGYVGESTGGSNKVAINDCFFIPAEINVDNRFNDCYTFAEQVNTPGNFYFYYHDGELGNTPQGYQLDYSTQEGLNDVAHKMYFNHNLNEEFSNDYDYYSEVNVTGMEENYYTDGREVTIAPTLTYGYNKVVPDRYYHWYIHQSQSAQEVTVLNVPGYYVIEGQVQQLTGNPCVGNAMDYFEIVGLNGGGTEDHPFAISYEDDWNTFVAVVNDGKDYSGKFVQLYDNITVTEMVGNYGYGAEGYPENCIFFKGTFDGGNHTLTFNHGTASEPYDKGFCAPFCAIDGATFQNLVVAGTIYTNKTYGAYAAGLIAHAQGSWHVSGCLNKVTIITSDMWYNTWYDGGFVANVEQCGIGDTPEFSNCIFNGQMLGGDANNIGGFAGRVRSGNLRLTNCLFAPSLMTVSHGNGYTFAGNSPVLNNCYYDTEWVKNQGKEAVVYDYQPVGLGEEVYSNTHFTVYEHGFLLNDKYYTDITSYTFNGGTSTSWHDLANWTKGGAAATALPTFDDNVVINGNAVISGSQDAATAGTITLGQGGTLTVEDGAQLVHCNEGVVATIKKNINAASHWGQGTYTPDNWYLIASPMKNDVDPDNPDNFDHTNLLTGTGYNFQYDLYRFNPASELEWENYKNEAHFDDFILENGKGYLYACKIDKTVEFTGGLKPYSEDNGDNEVSVEAGWNLVGNPFACNVYVGQPFYKMNETRTAVEAVENYSTDAIAPCTGIFINAAEAGAVTFTKDAAQQNGSKGKIQIDLKQANTRGASTGSTTTIDNAIVSFNEGSVLPKFRFMEQPASISIPQGDEEYAIVSVGRDVSGNVSTEIPLHFKTSKNGTYTLSFSLENMDLDYLHLIDNLTGADVDLLPLVIARNEATQGGREDSNNPQTASYTFTAKTTDYASRFRLVFSADEPFAFINNGNIIVNGEGTLQVLDAMGRVIRSTDVARNISTNGMAPGTYLLRLINGDDVRAQKIELP